MKTLIISDLHNHVDWVENFLAEVSHDEVVFLGDYFDDFYDTLEDIENTAKWLKESLTIFNRIHLWGNHDLWYSFPKLEFLMCSGNEKSKLGVIQLILDRTDWNKLKLCYYTQKWLISHAGVDERIFGHPVNGISIESIEKDCETALEVLKQGGQTPIVGCGRARYGRYPVGGITWSDWNKEFEGIDGINQIVGHTPDSQVREKTPLSQDGLKSKSQNYCIDCFNNYIGIIEDGIFSTIENKWKHIK